jgi:hypothetical protein
MPAETLMEYAIPILGKDGRAYRARACGRERSDQTWEGWFEFESADGVERWRTARETTQPNRADAVYWATGISEVFLQGALTRAMEPSPPLATPPPPSPPAFEGPAPPYSPALEGPVLDPFNAYTRGEPFLRRRLAALDAWHLRTMAQAYRIVGSVLEVDRLKKAELVELIVAHVRAVVAGEPTAPR